MRRCIEIVCVAFLLLTLVSQLLTYPATRDPDPDGYVSHAQRFGEGGVLLPPSHRLPGYPTFLWLLMRIPAPLAESVSWTQGALFVAFVVAAWRWARRHVGALPALLLLAIIAFPSYAARVAGQMLPDGPYALLFVTTFLWVGRWATARGPWRHLVPFGALLVALQAIRPTTIGLAALFALSLVAAAVLTRRHCWRSTVNRAAAMLVVAALAGLLVDQTLDTGARHYNASILPLKWALALPPAPGASSEADEYIEAVKAEWGRLHGRDIERERFGGYQPPAAFRYDRARAVWWDRVTAHPDRVLLAVVNDIRWYHYELALRFTPFWVDWPWLQLWGAPYPKDDGSEAYALFRATGIDLVTLRGSELVSLPVGVLIAVLRLVAVWGLLGIGVWRLSRRWPVLTLAWLLTAAGFCMALSATNTLDARYLLPVAMLIYLAQATGLAWIARVVTAPPHRGSPQPPSASHERAPGDRRRGAEGVGVPARRRTALPTAHTGDS